MSSESYVSQSERSEEDFAQNEQGALCHPVKVGSLRKGHYILVHDEFPCKILELTVSKTGKHGHAKANITAADIFTNKKYELKESTSHGIMCPNVRKEDFPLIDIDDDGLVSYMEPSGEFNTDIKLDTSDKLFTDMKADLAAGINTIVVSITFAMDHAAIMSYKKE